MNSFLPKYVNVKIYVNSIQDPFGKKKYFENIKANLT